MKLNITSSAQLSTHFKSLRRAKGWSQADLGQKLGIGQARVAQIEGAPGSISVDKFFQILHLLDAKLVVEALVVTQPRLTVGRAKEPGSQAVEPVKPARKPIIQDILKANIEAKSVAPARRTRTQFPLDSDLRASKPPLSKQGLLPPRKTPGKSPERSNTKKKW